MDSIFVSKEAWFNATFLISEIIKLHVSKIQKSINDFWIKIKTPNSSFVLLTCALFSGCNNDTTNYRSESANLIYNVVGGERLAVPVNYVDSQSYGSMLIIAAWPEMTGRPQDAAAYQRYTESNIRIHARPGSVRSLDAAYRIYLVGENSKGEQYRVERKGRAFGFDHGVAHPAKAKFITARSYSDIYVRRDIMGKYQALMRCDGGTSTDHYRPQCALFEIFPDMPNVEFKIGFDRDKFLSQVNEIEERVQTKFQEFRKLGNKQLAADPLARSKFREIEMTINDVRSSLTTRH